jgi:hypothetical protein
VVESSRSDAGVEARGGGDEEFPRDDDEVLSCGIHEGEWEWGEGRS